MIERETTLQTLVQQIRLCRMNLGAVLDRLEAFEPGPDAMNVLGDRTDRIFDEIRDLLENLQKMMGS